MVAMTVPSGTTCASNLPLKTRRWNTRLPPSSDTLKASLMKAVSSAAAIRGATSQPLGVFESSTTSGEVASIAARIAWFQASTL